MERATVVKLPFPPVYLAAAGIIATALVYIKIKGASGAGQAIGRGAVNLLDGVVTGAVSGAGQLVGVPGTNPDKCAAAKAAGSTWDASFDCPAADFLRWLWNR
ncbi:MAG: hypothetical protein RugAbin2_02406 [Rugosibacter sp.]|nr:hypothetical protein [Rugosibacter sp.]